MKEQPGTRRRIGVGLAVLLTAVITTACAQGQHAQTAQESPAIDGINATVGAIALREVSIATPTGGASYAAGAAAQLRLVLVNTSSTDDNLVSITTPSAAAVSLFGNANDAAGALSASASPTDSGSPSQSSSPTDTTSPSQSSSPTDTTSPSQSSSATASAVPLPLLLAAGQRTSFGISDGDKVLVITGLLKPLFAANQISITFTFQNAGAVTLTVPVQLSTPTSSPLVIPSLSGAQ